VRIGGADARPFLNALITNDIEILAPGRTVYACLLTPQGKFLHDFILHEDGDSIVMDCEGGSRARDLATLLTRYRLRSKVGIDVEENTPVFAIFGEWDGGTRDPRNPDLGRRTFERPALPEKPFSEWDRRRIALCIPDGSRDMEIGKSTLLECRIDALNGIAWDKGCYIGQELTARMKYLGIAKRHLYTVRLNSPAPEAFTDIEAADGERIGEMRSSSGDLALALLKDDALDKAVAAGFEVFSPSQNEAYSAMRPR